MYITIYLRNRTTLRQTSTTLLLKKPIAMEEAEGTTHSAYPLGQPLQPPSLPPSYSAPCSLLPSSHTSYEARDHAKTCAYYNILYIGLVRLAAQPS